MNRLFFTALSAVALLTAMSSNALALTEQFDMSRKQIINRLDAPFEEAREQVINRLSPTFGEAYQQNLDR